jgi:Tol biopolymer transport system component
VSDDPAHRLDSWKEIADYLGRDIRTVIRWEKEKGLPVRRMGGGRRQAVFAFREEIEAWLRSQPLDSGSGITPIDEPSAAPPESAGSAPRPVVVAAVRSRNALTWSVTALGVLFLAGWIYFARIYPRAEASLPPMKIVPLTTTPEEEFVPVISPDGKQVAFMRLLPSSNLTELYVQLVGAGDSLQITHGGAQGLPTWSPDGRFLAFVRCSASVKCAIFATPALGGEPRLIHSYADYKGQGLLDWSPDGRWIATPDRSSSEEPMSIYFYSPDSEQKLRITFPTQESNTDLFDRFSPDGRTIAFIRSSTGGISDIYTVPVSGGEPRRLTFEGKYIHSLAWAADGLSIVFSSTRSGDAGLWRVSTKGGAPTAISVRGQQVRFPSIPHQGNLLTYLQFEEDRNIWRLSLDGDKRSKEKPRAFISSTWDEIGPAYSPDGSRIAFASNRSGTNEIWLSGSDGSDPVRLTFSNGYLATSPSWSPDGRQIVFTAVGENRSNVAIVGAEGGTPRLLTSEVAVTAFPRWSRDGHWLYFGSNRSGEWQLWKMPAQGGALVQITKEGGFVGAESPDGKLLYFAKDILRPGVWRMPLEGGPPTLLIKDVYTSAWALTAHGIYFVDLYSSKVSFLDFKTGSTSFVFAPTRPIMVWGPNIAVSPDGRSLLYVQVDRRDSDIMLVENFR